MFIDAVYSKPIYGKVLDFDTEKLVSSLHEVDFQTINQPGLDLSKALTTGISSNLNILDEPKFAYLKMILKKEFDSFAKDQMKYKNDFEITTSWLTVSKKNEQSPFHNHNNCMYSGVFYLQTDENSGDIVFENFDHGRFFLEVEEHNMLNSLRWSITPVNGMFLIFPSEVYHKIAKNKSNKTRYSLAVNFIPVGLIGNSGGDSHLKINVEK
jgi:uncharacterized protein (TIGR02466 family)